MQLFSLKNIHAQYDRLSILHNISLNINEGEIISIIGPNGAGKSTLVKILIGALLPSSGEIKRAKGLTIGYVPQQLKLSETLPLSVKNFLSYPKRGEKYAEAVQSLGVNKYLSKDISELSGGELKRVLLAKALSVNPHILIMDEPAAGLDQNAVIDFYHNLSALRQTYGFAILIVSHDLNIVMKESERVICLNGHICCEGSPSEIRNMSEFNDLFDGQEKLGIFAHNHDHRHDDGFSKCTHD